jgi:cysteinyl-tRNA synthetase
MKEEVSINSLPEDIQKKLSEREEARQEKSWSRADELRTDIELAGYTMEDSPSGLRVFKK